MGDGSIELINIPGHADGLYAVKIRNEEGKFVLLFSDGGYARKSWEKMITSGIAADKELQKQSLAWIREGYRRYGNGILSWADFDRI